jgi:hypothetical protein
MNRDGIENESHPECSEVWNLGQLKTNQPREVIQ